MKEYRAFKLIFKLLCVGFAMLALTGLPQIIAYTPLLILLYFMIERFIEKGDM